VVSELKGKEQSVALRSFVVLVSVAALCTACGSAHRRATPPPRLPHDVGQHLASLSEDVANKLARGDSCGAATAAVNLDSQASAAIASGEVPRSLRAPLRRAADDLAQRVVCVQPPQPQPRAKHEKPPPKEKHKHHGGEGD
jgi:hypothetical protein